MISSWLKKWFWIGVAVLIVLAIVAFPGGGVWWFLPGGWVALWAVLTFVALVAGFDGKPING